MEKTVEIDLWALVMACLRRAWMILLCAVVAGAIAFSYTKLLVTPVYKASATFYVNNSTSDGKNTISSSDLSTAQRLVATYVNIIKSDTVLEKVIQQGNLNLKTAELRSLMQASSVDETELFSVSVTHPDPAMAAKIANAVAAVAPTEIQNIMIGSSTKVIDYAKVPTSPSAPSATRNAILGAAIGAFLAIAIVVVQQLLDRRIKNEDDLAHLANVPVLGVIPDFDTELKPSYVSFGDKKRKAAR